MMMITGQLSYLQQEGIPFAFNSDYDLWSNGQTKVIDSL